MVFPTFFTLSLNFAIVCVYIIHTHTHTHTHTYMQLLNPINVNGHLGCPLVLAFVNSTLQTLRCMHIFELVFYFSPDIYRGVGLQNHIAMLFLVFRFLRSLQTVFHSDCTNLHSHQWCTGFSFFPHPASTYCL